MEHLCTLYRLSFTYCLIHGFSSLTSSFSLDAIVFPGLNRDVYYKRGDLNIGAIMMLTSGTDDMGCSKKLYPNSWAIEYPEAVAFAVEKVNNDTALLPNLTLGFYIIDDCTDPSIALAQALTFLPRNESSCSIDTCPGRSLENNSYPLSSRYSTEPLPYYEVMGILSPILSTAAVPVSYMMAAAKVPMIGYTTTSDEFNDRTLHPYFLRVVTPNKYQAIAMLEFIWSNGWTYISVVYSQGTYGERAFETIKGSAAKYNICIAVSYRVGNEENMTAVARGLNANSRARAVILFADEQPARNLFAEIEILGAIGQFIWICCDSVANASKEKLLPHLKSVMGAFMFIYSTALVPEFYDYIRRQNVSTSTNPWFKPAWENTAGCSFADGSCKPNEDLTKYASFEYSPAPSLAMDAVLTFAHGAHSLISQTCPTANKDNVRDCVKRDLLLESLFNVSFKGYTGTIQFDKNDDFQGVYFINQMLYDEVEVLPSNGTGNMTFMKDLVQTRVAYYDASDGSLIYTNVNISWDHLLNITRIVPLSQTKQGPEVPESVCSGPCRPGEYKLQKELVCCWDCRKCRDNEKVTSKPAGCKACEQFTWPDPKTGYTSCLPIPLTHVQPSDTFPVILICLVLLAIIGTSFVVACYIYFHETRIMKAASRELSFLQFVGIFVGYITVICFQTTPTPNLCSALYFMFCLSFAWLYSPLLVKAVRIYRIFQSGSKNNQTPRFVSPTSQIVFASLIILSQIILCLIMYIISQPTAKKTQAVMTEKFVELSCDMTLPGLASFLVYNLLLVSACAIFAFKTRKLPDNFNESRFISMCVYTTLVIWLAFIPTYFTATQEYVKGILLSVALLLNHTVAVSFLFIPKVYACIFVDQETLVTKRFNDGGTSLDVPATCSRVGPASNSDVPRTGF
ncbi:unnamed protein product [Candidula unifasciata]|uniref:G-protein coupled receptors family 3 profile domain-containing protein n=1 Tax=Candidula unifasciata TaxID=100452 RepID=A0A8S3Z758_9EUPU|nr:unnamed protein product [Candidula unifasciata]